MFRIYTFFLVSLSIGDGTGFCGVFRFDKVAEMARFGVLTELDQEMDDNLVERRNGLDNAQDKELRYKKDWRNGNVEDIVDASYTRRLGDGEGGPVGCSVPEFATRAERGRFAREELGFVCFRCQEKRNNMERGSVGSLLQGRVSVVHEIAFRRHWR